jgi:predicted NAD/FAD-binding protein
VVHSDARFMPKTRRAWASWNYRVGNDGSHSTHYWMNRLQGVSENRDYFVSINPPHGIRPEAIHHQLEYEHPLFTTEAIAAQSRIPELHSAGEQTGRYYCGSWQRYGFHEDGIWSAHRLCESILKRDPWERNADFRPQAQP